MLSFYMRLACKVDIDKDGKLQVVLLRMKIYLESIRPPIKVNITPSKIVTNKIGCIELKRFYLNNFSRHLCKIYKRVRFTDNSKTTKVHDYKIKVIQEQEPKSFDYIVLRRLPRSLDQINSYV